MTMTADRLIREWFDEVWNQRKTETITRLLDANASLGGLTDQDGRTLQGCDAFRGLFDTFVSAFPDIRIEVLEVVSSGDMAAGLCRVTGTHRGTWMGLPPTNRPIDITGIAMVRERNGKAVETWNAFDFLALHQQLGFTLTPPAA